MKRTGISTGAKSLARGSTFKSERKPMKRSPLRSGGTRRSAGEKAQERLSSPQKRTKAFGRRAGKGISPASPAQRAKIVAEGQCRVCRRPAGSVTIDPAHVVPRSLGGCDHDCCVVALCREHHRDYDGRALDLLAFLTGPEQEHAVSHLGILLALERLTNRRWREA